MVRAMLCAVAAVVGAAFLSGCGEKLLSLIDDDGDGVPASVDCDDRSALWGDIANDQDCDTIVTAEDCDDTDPTRPLGDLDCDGVPIGSDCNDLSPFLFDITNDADCDGVLSAEDCDDADATLGITAADGACETFCPSGFVFVPPAQFAMGSPETELGRSDDETPHQVRLSQGYCLQATEVTYQEWSALMTDGGLGGLSAALPSDYGECDMRMGDDDASEIASCPARNVTWYDALRFANARSEAEGLPPCYTAEGAVTTSDGNPLSCEGYRLPTEAEWEYAARSGSSLATYIGDLAHGGCDEPVLDQVAWFCGSAGTGFFRNDVRKVRRLRASPAGFYDMLGNVSEWVWDAYGPYPEGPQTDPLGIVAADRRAPRVRRGGDVLGDLVEISPEFPADTPCLRSSGERHDSCANSVRAASRRSGNPELPSNTTGFRLARSRPTGAR